MRKILEYLEGRAEVELRTAFPEAMLNACAAGEIPLEQLERPDACILRARVRQRSLPALKAAAERCGCELEIRSLSGGRTLLSLLRRRIWLPVTGLCVLGLLLLSSLFIWEIDVVGNERLSRGELLRALADCGVEPGCFWPGLKGDLVRSRMLERVPELQWMTVNVSGSRAVLLVSERREKPEIFLEGDYRDLTASREGLVRSLSVLNGQPQVSPGQTVLKGQILISGSVESITAPPRLTHASGSVLAETYYELTAVHPLETEQKAPGGRGVSRFAVKIGNTRLNFFGNAKKELDGYDKIVHEYKLAAEGLFALPISLIREERIYRPVTAESWENPEEMQQRLLEELERSIRGEILEHSFSTRRQDGLLLVTLRARCLEDIAESSP